MLKWVDVSPTDWFYRDVLDASRLYLEPNGEGTLFEGIEYNGFTSGKKRIVQSYLTTDGQQEFELKGYVHAPGNSVLMYIEQIPVTPAKLENGKVTLARPLSAGQEVTIIYLGEPELRDEILNIEDPLPGQKTTRKQPYITDNSSYAYPRAVLTKAAQYISDYRHLPKEVCVANGVRLKRVEVASLDQSELRRVFQSRNNLYTVLDGTLIVSYNLNTIPVHITYSYGDEGEAKLTNERVVPTNGSANGVVLNDRFFPQLLVTRAEFFVLLQRMRKNIYNRYTDQLYVPNPINVREIPDLYPGKWYTDHLLDLLKEKFNDDSYVFPLYQDGRFRPEACITRAEAALNLNRFIEWAAERFR